MQMCASIQRCVCTAIPSNSFDEVGGGGVAHPLKEVVLRQRRRRRAEHVGVLHRRSIGATPEIQCQCVQLAHSQRIDNRLMIEVAIQKLLSGPAHIFKAHTSLKLSIDPNVLGLLIRSSPIGFVFFFLFLFFFLYVQVLIRSVDELSRVEYVIHQNFVSFYQTLCKHSLIVNQIKFELIFESEQFNFT